MFENALSNFALWAEIFISALKGARAIQNFDLKELIDKVYIHHVPSIAMGSTPNKTQSSSKQRQVDL